MGWSQAMAHSPHAHSPHPHESLDRSRWTKGHRVVGSLSFAYTHLPKKFLVSVAHALKTFLGFSPRKVYSYDPIKDPIYQNLIAIQGFSLRAEKMLFKKEVNWLKLADTFWQIQKIAATAMLKVYRIEGGERRGSTNSNQ